MDFRLTKEEALFQKMCREFALNEVEPIAAEIDAEERYPEETVQKLMKYGLMGIQFPKEVGGSGGNYICYSIAIEEMSRVCGTTGGIMSAHGTLGAWPIYAFGTPEQKEKWLRPLIEPKEGAKIGAFGLTEPNAGTDSAAQQTMAVKQEDGSYIMNGSKVFITGGGRADTYVVFAMTDKTKGNKGISAFIVDKDDPGFSIGKIEHKMGIRGSQTAELIFEDVHLPADRLLGKENGGFLQVAGATYEIHTDIPNTVQTDDKNVWIGSATGTPRVQNVKIYDRANGTYVPLDENKTYALAGMNYTLRNLGDGFAMFDGAELIKDYVSEDYLVMSTYAMTFGGVDAEGLPHLSSANSVLAEYPGYLLDYENPYGAGRISIL